MNSVFRRILPVVLFSFLAASSVYSQGLQTAKPEDVGLSSERLKRIDTFMKKCVQEKQFAGAIALVARKGKVAFFETYGMMDIEDGKPMRADNIFRLASMTKPITCTAVMILYEEGYFLLTDPISMYIPEFKNPRVLITTSAGGASSEPYTTVPAKREITIRDLLNHTAGITNGSGDFSELYRKSGIREIRSTPGATIGDMVKKLAALPLQYHPGEVFLYGSSHDVLGYLVEVISGMGFDEFLLERIFKPLSIKDTYFYVPEEKLSRVASLYEPNRNGGLDKVPDRISSKSQTYFSGGGGLSSTISDYARFAQMMLNGGELDGIRLLSRKTVELMTTNSIGDSAYSAFRTNSGDKYGLGFGIRTERGEYDEIESIGTYMWDGAYHTRFWVDPSEEMIGIFMSQLQPVNWRLPAIFRVLAYQSIID